MEEQKLLQEIESLRQALKACYFTNAQQQITLFNALQNKFGPEVAEIIEEVNGQDTCEAYLKSYGNSEDRTIESFIKLLWEPLRSKGYQFTIEPMDDGIQMKCTVCPLATMFKALGGAEWGYHLYCSADAYLVEGFNSKIGFKRTKTLMEGHDCCDHFYFMKA